jgi:predicted alpha-1,2-mannosidase
MARLAIAVLGVVGVRLLPACAPHDTCPNQGGCPAPISTSAGSGPALSVNPFIGTDNATVSGSPVPNGGSGSTYPGAAAPFGMVQWSPDTPNAVPPGYFYPDNEILGFSLTHLNGAGCPAQRDFPVLPFVGAFDPDQAQPLSATFSHSNELASPGFYEVKLDSGITVDLTATQRTGLARFTFPPGGDGRLLILSGWDWDVIVEAGWGLTVTGPDTIEGRRTDLFCLSGATTVYLAAQFDRPFSQASGWGSSNATATEVTSIPGGLALTFATTASNPIVQMKVALSYVSPEKARANLAAENPGWDFNRVHSSTVDLWNGYLGLANAKGGTADQTADFFTALYHVFLQPAAFSDADGEYFGFDQVTHPSDGHVHYANFSEWDIYRSWIQLVSLLAPQVASDIVRSLVLDGQQGGAMPRWAYGAKDTGVMVGDPADAIIANAYAFGATDFDAQAALGLMEHGANDVTAACNGISTRPDLSDYLNLGYCPMDAAMAVNGPSATTLEYAIADFSIAKFAAAIGQTDVAATFMPRGQNWRSVFDPLYQANGATGYVQPRLASDANGPPIFIATDPASENGFVEGSVAQYTFLAPQDLVGLDQALGGDAALTARLDALFGELNAGTASTFFYMGNEPGFETPWEYAWAGAPWRAQQVIWQIVNSSQVYSSTPGGLPGNDDLGAMSSWLVWGMLGMYPEVPGVGGLVLASPTFPEVDLTLANGSVFTITRDNPDPGAYYVQSATLNGQPTTSTWLPIGQVLAGGKIEFSLGNAPNMAWGSSPLDRPPATYP